VTNNPLAVFQRKKWSAFRKKCKSETPETDKAGEDVDAVYSHHATAAESRAHEPTAILERLFLPTG
jgi:hypothetical protein